VIPFPLDLASTATLSRSAGLSLFDLQILGSSLIIIGLLRGAARFRCECAHFIFILLLIVCLTDHAKEWHG